MRRNLGLFVPKSITKEIQSHYFIGVRRSVSKEMEIR
jgi:hypothetical protein